jgi:hypothetical protein
MGDFIGLRVDPGLRAQIDDEAEKTRRSRSDMLRVMADFYFEHHRARRKPRKEGAA